MERLAEEQIRVNVPGLVRPLMTWQFRQQVYAIRNPFLNNTNRREELNRILFPVKGGIADPGSFKTLFSKPAGITFRTGPAQFISLVTGNRE